jgi:uncharacterized membrane protein
MKKINGVILVLALFGSIGCGSDSENIAQEKLNIATEKWEDEGIRNYTFILDVSCACPKQEKKKITILDFDIAKTSFIPSNKIIAERNRTSDIKTMGEYFEIIQEAIDKKAYKVDVKYDKFYSYPVSIDIDYKKDVLDDAVTYTITHFVENDYDQVVCTQENNPICGKVDSREETFLNKCHFTINPNAIYLHDGVCQ